ncbi:MAG: 4'-phosphopantetheinyl transferase superfamily protein [Bacteroidota bacterium]
MTNPLPGWNTPPPSLSLTAGDVHVWRASFHELMPLLPHFKSLISVDEQMKAGRYRFEDNRDEYIIARGLLRHLLGSYLEQAPQSLQFFYNPYGKPALNLGTGENRLTFNLSHAHGYILYVFTRDREVGIDLERIRPEAAHDGVAERFFSKREVNTLRALPRHAQPIGFFNCWTRKEAYIKARGEGLSIPLNQFDVSLVPGEPAALLESRVDPADTNRWTLQSIDMGTRYIAALAVEGQGWNLTCWDWRQ